MSKTIYFLAVQTDILFVYKQNKALIQNHWITVGLLFALFSSLLSSSFATFLLVMIGIGSFVFQLYHSRVLKKLEDEGKALFFGKTKHERFQNLYLFLGFALLALIGMYNIIGGIFLVLALRSLFKFMFYIPSIQFVVNDYELIISRKHRSKVFDFSYANRLRFIYNMIAFDHPIYGKETWKDINMNRDKIAEIKTFLSDNFGKEMVLNPTTGLPYVN